MVDRVLFMKLSEFEALDRFLLLLHGHNSVQELKACYRAYLDLLSGRRIFVVVGPQEGIPHPCNVPLRQSMLSHRSCRLAGNLTNAE